MDTKLISELIKMVSHSSLTSLEVEEGSLKVKITNEPFTANAAAVAAPKMPVAGQMEQAAEAAPSGHIIKSPIVGIFHGLSKTGKTDLTAGDLVKKGDVLCVVEAMKLMNEVESDAAGEITDVLVKEGQQVEYGQPLFQIRE